MVTGAKRTLSALALSFAVYLMPIAGPRAGWLGEILWGDLSRGAVGRWARDPAWAARFSKEVRERGIRATFWSYLKNERKDILTQDLLNLMGAAGFTRVTCGVESTSDRVLNVIDKGTTF